MSKTLTDLRIDADSAKTKLNEAIITDKKSIIDSAKEKLNKAVKEYNAEVIRLEFITLKGKTHTMLEAIEQLNIATITEKEKEDKDTGIITYSIEPAIKQISLVELSKFCGNDIAIDNKWSYYIDKFCYLMTYRIASELGKPGSEVRRKLEQTYYITDVAKQMDMGKTPTSNTQMLKQLQTIVDAIIYKEDKNGNNIYKASSHDVAYILQTMSKRSKSGTVVTPRPLTMHTLIMDVLHKIVKGNSYKIDYKTKKQVEIETDETISNDENNNDKK